MIVKERNFPIQVYYLKKKSEFFIINNFPRGEKGKGNFNPEPRNEPALLSTLLCELKYNQLLYIKLKYMHFA